MAELLIRAKDNTHADPVKNQRGSYKRGDIVEVGPVGWDWGRLCLGPGHPLAARYQEGGMFYNGVEPKAPRDGGGFVVVRILKADGVTPVWSMTPIPVNGSGSKPPIPPKLASYMDPEQYLEFEGPVTRRLYQAVLDALPQNVKRQLNDTGYYEVRWQTVRSFIRNKVTRTTEVGVDEGELN